MHVVDLALRAAFEKCIAQTSDGAPPLAELAAEDIQTTVTAPVV
jgi:hypothetical protein